MTAHHSKHYYALVSFVSFVSIFFFLSGLWAGTNFSSLSLSVSLSFSSFSSASEIFFWFASNLLWEWRRHRANANSLFLSESRWVCVWAIDMRTSIKGSSRSTEVVPACVWLRQLYASSKFVVSKARGEGKKKKGQNREGEIRRDQGWR